MVESTGLSPELNKVRSENIFGALKNVWLEPRSDEYIYPLDYLPIVIPGGVGDLIINLPILDKLRSMVGKLRVYSNFPEVMKYFGYGSDLAPETVRPPHLYYLKLSTAPVWVYKGRFTRYIEDICDTHETLFDRTKYVSEKMQRYAAYQPNFDGELAREAVENGFNRRTLPRAILGLPINDGAYRQLRAVQTPVVDIEPFVTVNTGFDSNQIDCGMRSTKSWSMRYWADLVSTLKQRNPDHFIVQIGGKNSRPIKGVDENKAGQLTFAQSFDLLSRSRLHVDIEGGLVHAAHALGVQSVVIFGATPIDFFGYDDNYNIGPKECGGCWWTHKKWMEKCALYDEPKCLDSIQPDDVYWKIREALE